MQAPGVTGTARVITTAPQCYSLLLGSQAHCGLPCNHLGGSLRRNDSIGCCLHLVDPVHSDGHSVIRTVVSGSTMWHLKALYLGRWILELDLF